MQQTEQHRDVGVAPGGRHDVHVAHLWHKTGLKLKIFNLTEKHLDVGKSTFVCLNKRATVILLLHVRDQP